MGLSSCVRDVIMDAKEKPKVVVSCILSNDPVQRLNLSFTKGASLSEAPPLTEAVATLYDLSLHNEMEAVGNFQRQSDGEWTLDYEAVPGHEYRLEVNVPGYEMIHAEQQMPSDTADVGIGYFSNIRPYVAPWSGWIKETDKFSDAIQPSHPAALFSSCPQSFPASGSFPMSQLFASGGQSTGVSASASVLPMNTQD